MNIDYNNLNRQCKPIKKEIINAFLGALNDNDFIGGATVEQFEKKFSSIVERKYCVSCANGTDALYIALKALELKTGDIVLTTAHSWIATSEVITQAGGRVVFVDIEKNSPNISFLELKNKFSSKVVGVIIPHLYGMPAEINKISNWCKKNKLWLIEDCAQAHLARKKNKLVGTFGDIATYSFYPGKNLGALGDGGAITTNKKNLYDFMKDYANHGGKNRHIMEGINSRLDSIQAKFLTIKLPYLKKWNQKRLDIARKYVEDLKNIGDLKFYDGSIEDGAINHCFAILTEHRNELHQYLNENKIKTQITYPVSLPFLPAYQRLKHNIDDFPNAYKHQELNICLPVFPELKDSEIEYVIKKIKKFFESR